MIFASTHHPLRCCKTVICLLALSLTTLALAAQEVRSPKAKSQYTWPRLRDKLLSPPLTTESNQFGRLVWRMFNWDDPQLMPPAKMYKSFRTQLLRSKFRVSKVNLNDTKRFAALLAVTALGKNGILADKLPVGVFNGSEGKSLGIQHLPGLMFPKKYDRWTDIPDHISKDSDIGKCLEAMGKLCEPTMGRFASDMGLHVSFSTGTTRMRFISDDKSLKKKIDKIHRAVISPNEKPRRDTEVTKDKTVYIRDCVVCGKSGQTTYCDLCDPFAPDCPRYCGRQCQRMHWKASHKRFHSQRESKATE